MSLTFKQKLLAFIGMTKRNIWMFFRDKTNVFFSLLAQFIILFLYLAFLKQSYVDIINSNLQGFEELIAKNDVSNFINSWLLSGLIGSATITIAINSLTIMVQDKAKKIDFDYLASPINGPIITFAYFFGAIINTYIVSGFILTLGLIILSIIGNLYLGFIQIILLYVVLLFAVMSSTLLMMLIVSFFKKTSSLSAFSGVVSAGIGFLIGAYMPISQFSKPIQYIANIIPGSHVTCLFRNYLMSGPLEHINESLQGYDGGMFITTMKEVFSFKLNFLGTTIDIPIMYVYISAIIVITLVLNILLYKISSKRK